MPEIDKPLDHLGDTAVVVHDYAVDTRVSNVVVNQDQGKAAVASCEDDVLVIHVLSDEDQSGKATHCELLYQPIVFIGVACKLVGKQLVAIGPEHGFEADEDSSVERVAHKIRHA